MKKNYHNIEARGMLLSELKNFRRACRLQTICNFINIGLAIDGLLALAAIIHRMIFNTVHITLQVFLICPLLFFILSLFKPVKLKEIAIKIDDGLHMKERLTTSVHFLEEENSYAALLFSDTLKRIKGVRPQSLFPMKLNVTVSLAAVLCGMLLFYNFYNFTNREASIINNISPDLKLAMQKEGEIFKKLADKAEAGPSAVEALEREIIQSIESLGEGLQAEEIDKHDALLMLTDASASIKELYRKEKGGIDDLNTAENDELISGKKIADGIEETFNEVLNSIESAKQHIAEADIEPGRRPSERESVRSSSANDLTHNRAVSDLKGGAGDTISPAGLSVSQKGSSRDGQASGLNDEIYHSKDLEFPAESIILKYPDSVISLEHLPMKYHKIVKDYFDAVSGG